MNERRTGAVALLGLPRTGKSTYLGSLWQLIQDDGDQSLVEVSLRPPGVAVV